HRVELDEVLGHGRLVVEVGAQQTAPPPPDAGDLMPLLVDPVDDGLDAGVESRDVTAAGEDADAHVALLTLKTVAAPPGRSYGARQANGAGHPGARSGQDPVPSPPSAGQTRCLATRVGCDP